MFPSFDQITCALLHKVPDNRKTILAEFVSSLFKLYSDLYFTYLEINPLGKCGTIRYGFALKFAYEHPDIPVFYMENMIFWHVGSLPEHSWGKTRGIVEAKGIVALGIVGAWLT